MSLGTTSIDSLPTPNQTADPVQISNSENIKIENYGQQLNAERSAETQIPPIDYTSQLTSALKDAQSSGATVLPSRDIPQQTIGIQNDFQTKPDYIPESKTEDYIGDILDKEKIILENKKKENQNDNLDYIYQSIQLPLLVGILYFLFQLPFIRKNILTFLPNLFKNDGNPKLSGYIFNSVMFAILYSAIVFGLHYLKNNL
tara:strand:+ start:2861 stop:3463 length:603 start_codon:yes stop_codon:yes gene_type:complete